ncbi:MAG: alpha/beta hydrolase [Leptospiraceae bacterium]|nr:alpha/beta hydrolase [Leptospiraceae bacterium]MCP5498652.1 alpha/beta hydrolase [Leptospiraceae bacterium]
MTEELNQFFREGKFVNVDGTNIFTIDKGKGEIVLLLHGFFSTSYSFRKIIPILSQNFRVIAPDLPGIGFSEETGEVYSHRMLAKFLYKFLSKITEGPVHIVAHDYGGPISFLLINEHPEKVKTITVLSSFLNLKKLSFYFPLNILSVRFLGNLFSFFLSSSFLKTIYNTKLVSKDCKIGEELASDYAHLLLEGNKKNNFLKMCQCVDRTLYAQRDMESGLQKMIGGRQVIWGKEKPSFSVAQAEYIKEKLRLGFTNYIEGKHLLMEEHPDELAKRITVLVDKFSRKA